MALTQTQVSELYVSIFNRASEGEGNELWQNQNLSMADTATLMLDTQVAKDYFGTSLDTNQAFIEHIYLNTLNKTPADDAAGIANWVAELDAGRMTKGEVVANMIEAINTYAPGGENYDANDAKTVEAYQQFENRVTVSDHMADTIAHIEPTKDAIDATTFSKGLDVTADPLTVTAADAVIDNMLTLNGQPIKLTTDTDSVNEDGHTVTDANGVETAVEISDTEGVKLTAGNDTITAEVGTLQVGDKIVDKSTTDHDTLEVTLSSSDTMGTGGNAGNLEKGTTITNIEEITLRGEQGVSAYSLKGVTTTADDANIIVNIDHDGENGKFVSTTDIANGAVVSNVDGREIKDVNLIDRTTAINFAEVSYNPNINLTNGKIDAIGLDSIDNSKLENEKVTINMLNDADGKLTLGLFNDDDDANTATTEHDGGGFKEVTLVSSDVAMNVTLKTGTHLNNDNDSNQDGAVTAADKELTITDADGFGAHESYIFNDTATPSVKIKSSGNPDILDNLADTLNLEGSKDITITGTAQQLDQAKIRTEMTDGAKTHLDMSELKHTMVVNLTDAEVDEVIIDASTLGQGDQSAVEDWVGIADAAAGTKNATRDVQSLAQVGVDDDTTVKIASIGDWGVLAVTGDKDKQDDIHLSINTGTNKSNNGTLFLGGDLMAQSESSSAGTAGNSTEAGSSNAQSTQGGDANNAYLTVEGNSTLHELNMGSLLGKLIIDGSGNLRVDDGALVFDDSNVGFDTTNLFDKNTAAEVDAEGEGFILDGFGGDWVDAHAMTGDFRVNLRDGVDERGASDEITLSVSNDNNGIRIDFGSGNDMITGLGSGAEASADFGTLAGDNIDMGAGNDTVVIGINDTTATDNANSTLKKADFNAALSAEAHYSDTVVSDALNGAAKTYEAAVDANGSYDDRVNAEVYLGAGQDHVVFANQNSGFLAGMNGVRIKDFQAGSGGDKMGFQMFSQEEINLLGDNSADKGTDDQTVNPNHLNLFNNGEVIADSDVGYNGKYVINGQDVGNDNLNTTHNSAGDVPTYTDDGADTGDNDGNVVLISTSDIHKFNAASTDALWAGNVHDVNAAGTPADAAKAVFMDVQNDYKNDAPIGDEHQYETIVLVGETTGTEGVKIFYVTDDPTEVSTQNHEGDTDGTPTASLVGFLEGVNINDIVEDNFDFI